MLPASSGMHVPAPRAAAAPVWDTYPCWDQPTPGTTALQRDSPAGTHGTYELPPIVLPPPPEGPGEQLPSVLPAGTGDPAVPLRWPHAGDTSCQAQRAWQTRLLGGSAGVRWCRPPAGLCVFVPGCRRAGTKHSSTGIGGHTWCGFAASAGEQGGVIRHPAQP